MSGWIGVDLDGTLAEYTGWKGIDHVGKPVPAMVKRVKDWIAKGQDVKVFTARVSCGEPVYRCTAILLFLPGTSCPASCLLCKFWVPTRVCVLCV